MNRAQKILWEWGFQMCRWLNPNYECKFGCSEVNVERLDPCPFAEHEKWASCPCYETPGYD